MARASRFMMGCLLRDLVFEPANILYPVEFAKRCQALENTGLEIEVLDQAALEKIGMGALIGVGQGSVRGLLWLL